MTSPDGTNNYTLDDTNQLLTASLTSENNAYDANGNRDNGGWATAADNRLTSDGTYNYQYDNEGNRTRRTCIADGSWVEYAWDYRNRATQETFKNGAGTVVKIVSYTYDAQGRQIRRGYDDDGAGSDPMTYLYDVYQGNNPLLELNSLAATTPTHRYLYGLAADEIFATDKCTGALSGVLWGLDDQEGTPRDAIDSTAAPTDRHLKVDSFGKPIAGTAPISDYLFGLSGMAYDPATAEYKTLNRKYDPQAQRFTSQDPTTGSGTNDYAWCGNNPSIFTDPSGLCYEGFSFHSTGDDYMIPAWNYVNSGAMAADYAVRNSMTNNMLNTFSYSSRSSNAQGNLNDQVDQLHQQMVNDPVNGLAAVKNLMENHPFYQTSEVTPEDVVSSRTSLSFLVNQSLARSRAAASDNRASVNWANPWTAGATGGLLGTAQGGLNSINGVQDIAIGLDNMMIPPPNTTDSTPRAVAQVMDRFCRPSSPR